MVWKSRFLTVFRKRYVDFSFPSTFVPGSEKSKYNFRSRGTFAAWSFRSSESFALWEDNEHYKNFRSKRQKRAKATRNTTTSVCITVPLWQIRIFGYFFHAKSGYPNFYVQAPYGILYTVLEHCLYFAVFYGAFQLRSNARQIVCH